MTQGLANPERLLLGLYEALDRTAPAKQEGTLANAVSPDLVELRRCLRGCQAEGLAL